MRSLNFFTKLKKLSVSQKKFKNARESIKCRSYFVHDPYQFDEEEFNEVRWFRLDDIPYEKSDPHMRRFIKKLKGKL